MGTLPWPLEGNAFRTWAEWLSRCGRMAGLRLKGTRRAGAQRWILEGAFPCTQGLTNTGLGHKSRPMLMLKVGFRILPDEVFKTRERKWKGKTWVLLGSLANADTDESSNWPNVYKNSKQWWDASILKLKLTTFISLSHQDWTLVRSNAKCASSPSVGSGMFLQRPRDNSEIECCLS